MIITAAVLAAAGDHVPTLPLTVSILVTLLVYWLAEEYAELLGEQLEGPAVAHVAGYPRGTGIYLADGQRLLHSAALARAGATARGLAP